MEFRLELTQKFLGLGLGTEQRIKLAEKMIQDTNSYEQARELARLTVELIKRG